MIPGMFKRVLRNYAAQGVFEKIAGLILGRPLNNQFVNEYNEMLLQVIRDEQGNNQLPIITEMDFGHTCPTFTIPYGVVAEIDAGQKRFSIIERAVTD
jgi:muramoyltetrapeptide carboxypeptidase LdcA involved in peptidoglycan recycling